MAKFRVRSPDGLSWDVDAPDGSTQEDAIAYVRSKYAQNRAKIDRAGSQLVNETVDTAMVPFVAAGRTFDKLGAGIQETNLGAQVAGRELLGAQSGDQLRQLAALEQHQRGNDAAYAPLREKHPFLTGAGEAAPLMASPVGQGSALGRVFAPAIAEAVTQGLSYGSPEERAKNAALGGGMALGGGALGEGLRTVIAPARSSLSAAQQSALDAAGKTIGYKPRASELTGSETLRRLEDTVARQPGGAGPMRDLMDQNDRAIARHLANGIGENADALTTDVFARASDRRGLQYDSLKARADMPVVQDIFDALNRAEKMLTAGDSSGPKKVAYDTLQRLKDQLYQSKQFDGEAYQAWTSDLSAQARSLGKENRTAAAALREVEKAMDREARGADAPLWSRADKEHATQELLMKPGIVNEQTGVASLPRLASAVERQYGKSLKTGKMDGPLFDVADLGRAMPPMREGSQTAGREAFGGLPGWLMTAPNYVAAKALSSEFGRDYLSKGLLGNPAISRGLGALLGGGSIPLSMSEIEMFLLGRQ